jgi:Protein of unknown function (DUF3732)
MTMQILKISLYGKNGERRDVDLELGKVNIITGASQRGKTSLIHIVEYCLGASECAVAEGYIRQTVDWYSILLQFPDCQVFIARAAPLPGAKANSAAYMLIEKEVDVPEKSELSNSTNIDSVVGFLTCKVGVPELVTEVPEGQTRHEVRIGFRHSRYYLFQSQNEIANNEILFHQQAKPHIPQNIKDTLPYFIGAAEDDRLSEIEKLRSLKRERAQLAKQLKEIESIKGEGLQKGYVLLADAAELNLYDSTDLIPRENVLIDALEKIAQWSPSEVEDGEHSDPLIALEHEYQALLQQKNNLKLRLREAQEYSLSESGFESAVNEQAYRLKSIGLFQKFEKTQELCPVCDTPHDGNTKFETVITSALDDLTNKLEGVGRSKPRVSGYVSQLKDEQSKIGLQLKRTKIAINNIREQDHELARYEELNIKRARLSGKVALYVDSIDWNKDSSDLVNQINLLEEQINVLSDKLDPEALQEKFNAQLNCIAEDMTLWAKELKLEHSEYRIRLDAKKLTVVADTPYGSVPLSNMGSGENWVGYHLVTYLALAKWFIKQSRPVGRFIFFDQPTQVYFPADRSETGDLSEIERDEDRQAVKYMYQWIFQIVELLSPDLQVIITDHADIDEDWFQDAVRDHKWRSDYALIPRHWYEMPDMDKNITE